MGRVTGVAPGWGGALSRREALTRADMLLCAEEVERWKAAGEHYRRGLLVRSPRPCSGIPPWGARPSSCSLSASGCVVAIRHGSPLHCLVLILILDQRWRWCGVRRKNSTLLLCRRLSSSQLSGPSFSDSWSEIPGVSPVGFHTSCSHPNDLLASLQLPLITL